MEPAHVLPRLTGSSVVVDTSCPRKASGRPLLGIF